MFHIWYKETIKLEKLFKLSCIKKKFRLKQLKYDGNSSLTWGVFCSQIFSFVKSTAVTSKLLRLLVQDQKTSFSELN